MGTDHKNVIKLKNGITSRWHKLTAQPLFVPILGGLIVGTLNLLHYRISPLLGPGARSAGISIGGPMATSFSWIEKKIMGAQVLFPGIPAFLSVLVAGLILGSLLSALASRELTWAMFYRSRLSGSQTVKALAGGFIVGFGVLLGNGCLIKHGLSGVPGLSLEAVTSIAGMVVGIWGTLKIVERIEGA